MRHRCGLTLFPGRRGVWLAWVYGRGSSRERAVCVSRECHVFLLFPFCHLPPLPFIACSLCNSTALVVVLNAPRAALTCSTRTESLL